ncbi:hypothetical protein [Microbacterium sp.]|uniref:hypothetical protein n=1 Tax=Microbacterium sp. TaxID=51671 RepID=UPI0039E69147
MSHNVVVDLVRSLIDHMRGAPAEWDAFAIVIDFDGERVAGTHGYTYSADGSTDPVASNPRQVKPYALAFLASRYAPGATPPVGLLVQFDRTNGQYEVTFEDTDRARWKVTPANIDTMADTIRPNFTD